MTHMYFSAEGRISYGHLGRTNSCWFINSLTKIQPPLDSAMENGSEKCSLLIIAFIPSSHQTDLSAIYSGPKVMILSCPDHVHLICINDHSSLSVCLNLLICKLTTNDITVCDIACCVQNKDYLLTYLLTYFLTGLSLWLSWQRSALSQE